MANIYFHIDMNAFFVNAEILLDPSLKGKPVAVCGSTRRSVISTCSYEARAFGVHSAQPVKEALMLCPNLIMVEGHYRLYTQLSNQFMQIIKEYTQEIEQASIDECYADVTTVIQRYPKPLDLAFEIQRRILEEVGIPCSIGVGPNMFLAKMASDMKKPMGITVLRIRDVPQMMWPLPIGDMRGVGKKTEPLLKALGIQTIGDLANYKDSNALQAIFGKNTEAMLKRTNGYDNRQIVKEWDPKSMGVSETLLDDVTDYEEIRGMFRSLSRKLSGRLKKERLLGSSLQIRIKYFDFRNIDRSIKLDSYIWKSEDLFNYAICLFDENWDNQAIRLVGISLSNLKSGDEVVNQLDLFNSAIADKEETASVLKDLNRMLNSFSFMRASDLMRKQNHEN